MEILCLEQVFESGSLATPKRSSFVRSFFFIFSPRSSLGDAEEERTCYSSLVACYVRMEEEERTLPRPEGISIFIAFRYVKFMFPCAVSKGVTLLTGNAFPSLFLYIFVIEELQQWQTLFTINMSAMSASSYL